MVNKRRIRLSERNYGVFTRSLMNICAVEENGMEEGKRLMELFSGYCNIDYLLDNPGALASFENTCRQYFKETTLALIEGIFIGFREPKRGKIKKKNKVVKAKAKTKTKDVKKEVKVELDWNDAMINVYVDDSDREIILID